MFTLKEKVFVLNIDTTTFYIMLMFYIITFCLRILSTACSLFLVCNYFIFFYWYSSSRSRPSRSGFIYGTLSPKTFEGSRNKLKITISQCLKINGPKISPLKLLFSQTNIRRNLKIIKIKKKKKTTTCKRHGPNHGTPINYVIADKEQGSAFSLLSVTSSIAPIFSSISWCVGNGCPSYENLTNVLARKYIKLKKG